MRAVLALVTAAAAQNPQGCFRAAEDLCRRHRRTEAACTKCEADNADALKKAQCTATELAQFCTPRPCEQTMNRLCHEEEDNEKLCKQCATQNDAELKRVQCTTADTDAYCETQAPGQIECLIALRDTCVNQQSDYVACTQCTAAYADRLKQANCDAHILTDFCTPRQCNALLYGACGQEIDSVDLCKKCTTANAANLAAVKCTGEEIDAFCHPSLPGPGECFLAQADTCQAHRREEQACKECQTAYADRLKAAKCTADELEDFCMPRDCLRAFGRACGQEAQKPDWGPAACKSCEDKNAAALKDACDADALHALCNPPTKQ